MDKFSKGTIHSTSNEVIWPRKFSNFMHGLKSAILAIFQKSADWLDWPCPVSAALQNGSQEFFLSFIFKFLSIFLNMKPSSEVAPGLLVIQIPIKAVCEK